MTREGGPRGGRALTALAIVGVMAGCRSAGPWEAIGPDRRTLVTVASRGGRQCVAVGERLDGCYDGVSLPTVAIAGPHLAYAVQVGRRWAVVHHGEAGPMWEGVGRPCLSPDGTHVAYPALESGRWRVVVDRAPGEAFDAILAGSLRFDSGGRRTAYAGTRDGGMWVVLDGVREGPWAAVAQLQFDPSGAHFGYTGRDAAGTSVVIDGWVGPPHGQVGELVVGGTRAPTPEWGAPARSAYAAAEGGPWRVRADGVSGPPFDAVRDLVLLPEGVAYVGRRDGRETLVRGAQVGEWHDRVSAAAFADDGRWGYVADEAEQARVIIEGREVTAAPWAADVAFGVGGRSAFVVGDGEGSIVVDEAGRHPFDLVVAGSLLYVDGGRTWACLVGNERRRELFVVAGGRRVGSAFDWSELVRLARGDGDPASIRAWVAAEAERALADAGR